MDEKLKNKLYKKAKKARENAYVPYSEFPLGAALLTDEGKIFTGCNIEIANYGLTNCAERTAIFKAVSEGYKDFKAIMVLSGTEEPVTPCGSCRQVISEFGYDVEVILTNMAGDEISYNIKELLPGAFKQEDME